MVCKKCNGHGWVTTYYGEGNTGKELCPKCKGHTERIFYPNPKGGEAVWRHPTGFGT